MSNYFKITSKDIESLDSRTRASLINKLSGFKSPVLLGTCDQKGQNNLSIISSIFHIGSSPPLLGLVLRPPSNNFSHTHDNIIKTQQFTISHVHDGIIKQAHRCSAKFPRAVSEFEAVNLTPLISKSADWIAPAVLESKIRIGLILNSKIDLPNKCILIIGEIKWIESDEASFEKAQINFDANDISVLGLYDYYKSYRLFKLGYEHYDDAQSSLA